MAAKSISIPPNPSTRIGQRRAAARKATPDLERDAEAEVTASVAVARPTRPMQATPTHRFRVGERLQVGGGGYSIARAAAACRVVALLPYEGRGSLLYRVRSDAEAFERVVAEVDLSRS